MSFIDRLLGRARAGRIDSEIEEEIRFHLEMRRDANEAAGMGPKEALAAARRSFGDTQRVHDAGSVELGGRRSVVARQPFWDTLLQDVRFGIRVLLQNRIATAVAILSLGLGIGANTANFSVVNGILLRQLPFVDGDRVVFIDAWNPDRGDGDAPATWADLDALRNSGALQGLGAFSTRSFTLTGGDRPERVAGAVVTPELFQVLGVDPQVGRHFAEDEGAEAGFEPVVMISDGLRERLFGADADVIGQPLRINGREIPIVGVMPAGFRFPERHDVWLPLGVEDVTDHERRFARAVGRLAPGVDLATAQRMASGIAARNAEQFPDTHQGWDLRVQEFRHGFFDASARLSLYLLLAAVSFVLLLACANVANLLLARATDRQAELALRAALGARRGRLVRQMLTESVLLGLAGGIAGIAVARVWLETMVGTIPAGELQYWVQVGIDSTTLVYTAAISVGTGLVFGVLPALYAVRRDLSGEIKETGRGAVGGGRSRLRSGLVIGEVALAMILVTAATLMMRSFLELQRADPGFETDRVLSLRLTLAGDQYDDPLARAEYFRQAAARVGELPGVAAAAITSSIPADDGGPAVAVLAEGGSRTDDEALIATGLLSNRGLFSALGVELLQGRDFLDAEAAAPDAPVAIVGATLAEMLWSGEPAIGERLWLPELERSLTVIGVAPDLTYEEFGEETRSSRLQLHLPYGLGAWRGMALLVFTPGDPAQQVAPVRDALMELDPTLAPYDIMTMRDRRAFTTWPQAVFGRSFAAFGAIALLLAFCGVYAVVAYTVSRRTHEMGVRLALGARPADVRRDVVRQALKMTALGVAVGLAGGAVFARALSGILYGVSASDPWTFVAAALILPVAAFAASWVPARRASRVDPAAVLRAD